MGMNSNNNIIGQLSKGMNMDPKQVKAAIDSGDISKLTASLSKADMDKVQSILRDKEKLQEILESPFGKSFMKNFGK
jgi:hypothetical protein